MMALGKEKYDSFVAKHSLKPPALHHSSLKAGGPADRQRRGNSSGEGKGRGKQDDRKGAKSGGSKGSSKPRRNQEDRDGWRKA